jgi:hypothetical protein
MPEALKGIEAITADYERHSLRAKLSRRAIFCDGSSVTVVLGESDDVSDGDLRLRSRSVTKGGKR